MEVINDNSFVIKKYDSITFFIELFVYVSQCMPVSYLITSQFYFEYNFTSCDLFCHVENQ